MKTTRGILLAIAPLLAACSAKSSNLTPQQEYYAGRSFSANVVHQYSRIVDDPALQEYVFNVGTFLAVNSDRAETFKGPYLSYHFAVLDTDEINAFAASSGFVFITKGLLKQCHDEDELASVLAHEISHVVMKHPEDAAATAKAHSESAQMWGNIFQAAGAVAQEVGQQQGKQNLAQGGALLKDNANKFSNAMNEMFGNLIRKGYDRDKELAADRGGIEVLSRAGYDATAMRRMLERLGAPKGGALGWVGSTHPAPKDRVGALDQYLAQKKAAGQPVRGRTEEVRTARFQKAMAGIK